MRWKILLTDGLKAEGQAILSREAEVADRNGIGAEELLDVIGQYDAVIVRSRTKITAAVLEAAATHRVALEINAHPRRLDLADHLVQQALARGIVLAVDTDAHAPADFDNRPYGILTARRGWASAEDILNAWPTDQLLAWLRRRPPLDT